MKHLLRTLAAVGVFAALPLCTHAGDAVVWCPETGLFQDGYDSSGPANELVDMLIAKLKLRGGHHPVVIYQSNRTGFLAVAMGKDKAGQYHMAVGDGDTQAIADAVALATLHREAPTLNEGEIRVRHHSTGTQ